MLTIDLIISNGGSCEGGGSDDEDGELFSLIPLHIDEHSRVCNGVRCCGLLQYVRFLKRNVVLIPPVR